MSHYQVVLTKTPAVLLFELFNHHNDGKYNFDTLKFTDVKPYSIRDGFDTEVTVTSLIQSPEYEVPHAQIYYTRMDLAKLFSLVTCDVLTSRLNPIPNMPKVIEDIAYRYGFNISAGFEIQYDDTTSHHKLVALPHNPAFIGEVIINEVRALDGDRVILKELDGFKNIDQGGDIDAILPPVESVTESTNVISTAAIGDDIMVLYKTLGGECRSKVINATTGEEKPWGNLIIAENSAVCADAGVFYLMQCVKDKNSRDFMVAVSVLGENVNSPNRNNMLTKPPKLTPYELTCPKIHVDNNQLRYMSNLVVMAINVEANIITRTFSINGENPQLIPGIGGQQSFMVMTDTGRIFKCDSSTGLGVLLVDHKWETPRKFDSLILENRWDLDRGPVMVYDDNREMAFSISPFTGEVTELSLGAAQGFSEALKTTKSYSAAGCITGEVPVAVLAVDDKFSVYPLLLK